MEPAALIGKLHESDQYHVTPGGAEPSGLDVKTACGKIAEAEVKGLGMICFFIAFVNQMFHVYIVSQLGRALYNKGSIRTLTQNKIDCRGAIYLVQKGYWD